MSANSQVARNQSRQTFDSVYESTNPITTIAGQRMVEWFTGNSLNTDVWNDEVTLNWIKASFQKKGKWEYRLIFIK